MEKHQGLPARSVNSQPLPGVGSAANVETMAGVGWEA